jgi:hypothetical protein
MFIANAEMIGGPFDGCTGTVHYSVASFILQYRNYYCVYERPDLSYRFYHIKNVTLDEFIDMNLRRNAEIAAEQRAKREGRTKRYERND